MVVAAERNNGLEYFVVVLLMIDCFCIWIKFVEYRIPCRPFLRFAAH